MIAMKNSDTTPHTIRIHFGHVQSETRLVQTGSNSLESQSRVRKFDRQGLLTETGEWGTIMHTTNVPDELMSETLGSKYRRPNKGPTWFRRLLDSRASPRNAL